MATLIPALLGGLSSLAGGLFNKPQTTTSNSNTSSEATQNTAQSGSSLPVYDPYQLQMRNFLLGQFYNRSNPAYVNQLVNSSINTGTNSINDAAGPQELALRNSLAGRGLSYSGTAGTALGQQQNQRTGQITNLQAQRPLLQDAIQGGNLTSFSQFLQGLPVGTQSSSTGYSNTQGTQDTHSTTTGPNNVFGGAVNGLGSSLGLLYGLGAFNPKNNQPTGNMNTSGGSGALS